MIEVIVGLFVPRGDSENPVEWKHSPVPVAYKFLPRVNDQLSFKVSHEPKFVGAKRITSSFCSFKVTKVVHEWDEQGLKHYIEAIAVDVKDFDRWHRPERQPWVCQLYFKRGDGRSLVRGSEIDVS